MKFIQSYYDKLILGVLLVALIAAMVLQVWALLEAKKDVEFNDRDLTDVIAKKQQVGALSDDNFPAQIDMDKSRLWQRYPGEGSLLTPARYVSALDGSQYLLHFSTRVNPFTKTRDDAAGIGDATVEGTGDEPQPIAGQDGDGDGIPDSVEETNGLDAVNSRDAHFDKDGDGFSNVEEFRAKTDMADPRSHPPLATLLRFHREITRAVPVVLKNVMAPGRDKGTWEIAANVAGRDVLTLRVGGKIPDSEYTITDAGQRGNIWYITVQGEDGNAIVLPKGRVVRDPHSKIGQFAFLLNRSYVRARLGSQFALTASDGTAENYEFVSLEGSRATIKRLPDGKLFAVGPFTDRDRNRLLKPLGGRLGVEPGEEVPGMP